MVRRGLLRALAHGDSQSTFAAAIGIHRKTISRYVRDHDDFRAKIDAAKVLGRQAGLMNAAEHTAAVDDLVASEPLATGVEPPAVVTEPVVIRPLLRPTSVVEAEVVDDGTPIQDTDDPFHGLTPLTDRALEAMFWRTMNDPSASERMQIAHAHLLVKLRSSKQKTATLLHLGNVAAQSRATPSRGMTQGAVSETIHKIIGPPPDDDGESDEGAA